MNSRRLCGKSQRSRPKAALSYGSVKNLQLAACTDEQQLISLLYYLLAAGHINSAVGTQKLQTFAAVAFREAKTAQAASFDGRSLLQIE